MRKNVFDAFYGAESSDYLIKVLPGAFTLGISVSEYGISVI